MYINFQQNRVSSSVKTVHINLFAKNLKCINLPLSIVILEKSFISDIHHRILQHRVDTDTDTDKSLF